MEKGRKQIKIAVTGGIGSGKSTVCEIISALGYSVFSCDKINSEIRESADYVEKISAAFPSAVEYGCVNRKILASIVFNNPTALKKLNAITHPLIMKELIMQMDSCEDRLVFSEVPLLFEGGYQDIFDKIIIVSRCEQDRILAVQLRDGLSEEEIKSRIKNQIDYSKIYNYIKEGDSSKVHILTNSDSLSDLKQKTIELIKNF